jgi:hypothetical protein
MSKSLDALKAFDVTSADVVVWTFKKSQNAKTKLPVFNGHWVDTTGVLDEALKVALVEARAAITEIQEYGLLAQNNEGSALSITLEETYAALVLDQTADPTPRRKVKTLKQLINAAFYVVKLTASGQSIFAVRRTDDSWRTKKAKNALSVVFADDQLTIDKDTRFSLSKYFDFFIVDDTILVLNKGHFESLLSYKEAHIEEFADLQKEPEFLAVFTDLAHLVDYVGVNKIQLRRISAIRQKSHYKNSDFMDRLRAECKALGFNIAFDANGSIIPTPESCRHIFQALLDHRLDSRLSQKIYDVENTADVT